MARVTKPTAKTTKGSKPSRITKTQKKDEPKRSVGRPSSYKPEYDEQAFNLCLLGATDKEMATFFKVSEQTINSWKIEFPEFLESLDKGKIEADAKVAKSLYNRAIGYTGKKTVTANIGGVITDVKVIDEHVGPDVTAQIFWLKNRQRDKWRDKQDHELTGPGGGPLQSVQVPTDPIEAAKIYKEFLG